MVSMRRIGLLKVGTFAISLSFFNNHWVCSALLKEIICALRSVQSHKTITPIWSFRVELATMFLIGIRIHECKIND